MLFLLLITWVRITETSKSYKICTQITRLLAPDGSLICFKLLHYRRRTYKQDIKSAQNICQQSNATGNGLAPLDPCVPLILTQVWFAWKIHTSNGLDDVIQIGWWCITKYLGIPSVEAYNSSWQHWKRLFVLSWEYTEPRLLLRGNAWECMACKVIEIHRTTASDCVKMRRAAASISVEVRGTATRKCVEMRRTAACVGMRVAWMPPNRGSSTLARMGSTREVRLKCGSSAWNRGCTYWWVPYLYRTETLRVEKHPLDTYDLFGKLLWHSRNRIPGRFLS